MVAAPSVCSLQCPSHIESLPDVENFIALATFCWLRLCVVMCSSSRCTSCACSVEEARGAAAEAVAVVEVGAGGMGAPVDVAVFEVGAEPSAPGRAAHMASCCMRPLPLTEQSLLQCRQGVLSEGVLSVGSLASSTGRCTVDSTGTYTQRQDQYPIDLLASTFHVLPSALRTQ